MLIIYGLIIILIGAMICNKYKVPFASIDSYKYHDLQKYLLGELTIATLGSIHKPILWIYVPTEYNSRKWESFGSRSSFNLNQPYLYMTTQNIINKCMHSFHVMIIDDTSFAKLLPEWKYHPSNLTPSIRQLGFLEILYMYGGMITPISLLCFTDLIEMYHIGTNVAKMFVGENINYTNYENRHFIPDIGLMGAYKRNPTVLMLARYIRDHILTGFDYTAASVNKITELVISEIKTKNINLIPGTALGVCTDTNKPIRLEALMSFNEIPVTKHTIYGLWIPHEQLLKRNTYNWFTRLSEYQIRQSKLAICKYISTPTVSNIHSCSEVGYSVAKDPIIPCTRNSFVTKWNTPLYKGMYGPKPIYLGYDVVPTDN
jgi:hypothetical protein